VLLGYGFDLDASVRVPAHDRKRLEGLAQYIMRPPLSRSRLERQADGRYLIRLKKSWSDGSTHIVLDGVELLGRMSALVPPPRAHLIRYFGVLAPRAKLRREVVPKRPPVDTRCLHATATSAEAERDHQRRLTWSQLLARVFTVDILECPKCHSRMQRVEWATRPERIKALLETTGPPVAAKAAA
jgi:hypothetical protein